jgi:Ankyrin repeats (3 copies)
MRRPDLRPSVENMDRLLSAIVERDRASVARMLGADGSLARLPFGVSRLYGAGVGRWLYQGDTALHLAAAAYALEIVKLLFAAGADVDKPGTKRWSTPLHYASEGAVGATWWTPARQVETIQYLISAGAAVGAQDKNGATPLHRAVRCRCAAAAAALLESGADPTRTNASGSTAFHLAVQNTGRGGTGSDVAKLAQCQIIEELLSRGVSVRLRDGRGRTVLECASSASVRVLLAAA